MSNLWKIPLPPYLEKLETNNGISKSKRLRTALEEPPMIDNGIQYLIEWILTIACYLQLLIAITFSRMNETFTDIIARFRALKDRSSHTEMTPHTGTSNITKNWHHVRCTKCHARGHTTDTCLSQNPAAVRRRIANNKKTNKKKSPVNPEYIPYAPTPLFYPPTSGPWTTTFIADTTKLRQGKAQSKRDKGRSNKNKSKTFT